MQCPRCGIKSEVEIWDTINAQVSPEAKGALLEGEINVYRCDICKFEAGISIPLLYHDMRNGFCVQFFSSEKMRDDRFFEQFTPNAQMKTDRTAPDDELPDYFRNIHFVFGMNELARYIIFRDKLALHIEKSGSSGLTA